jgi:hypothetical protein
MLIITTLMVTTLKTCGIILVLTLDSSVNQLVDTLRKNMVVNLNRYTKKKNTQILNKTMYMGTYNVH